MDEKSVYCDLNAMEPSPLSPSPELSSSPSDSTPGTDAHAATVTHALESVAPASTSSGTNSETRCFQHYEVCLNADGTTLHELGRGAMGVTYKARDVNLDAPVALKIINARFSRDPLVRERFRREARAAAQLRHPNVANVFHFGETPAGECFYAMEYIEGETLAARVQRTGPLPAPHVLEIALQITSALIAAERRGLVHRDLKPANIMLVDAMGLSPRHGTATHHLLAKVIDFGLAKAVAAAAADANGGAASAAALTHGGFLGTPAYSSPEQVEGGELDARSDIFSLGATLWFLLTAQAPFAGRSLSEIHHRKMHRPLATDTLVAAGVPAPLPALLQSMLASDPTRRPASPTALFETLEQCREEIGIVRSSQHRQSANPVVPLPASRSWNRGVLAAVAAFALLLTVAGTIAFFQQSNGQRHDIAAPAKQSSSSAQTAVSIDEKSIAVLPLENLSEDKANAFFADGIQDDVLASLAKIKELKVISRSSVMAFRDPARRNLREISQQLGVVHVLEGSVRRAANRVLVNVALIDTRNNAQIWAEHYDRTLENSLTLQSELATEIATALRATLSPEEKARVAAKPTDNADAYVLYLRARDYQTRPNVLSQNYDVAERLYTQALALDPKFALAHARLSAVLAFSHENFRPSVELHDRARAEAEEALRLQPDLGEGYIARALCLYWTEKNYAAALRELEVAARLLPNNFEADQYSGAIQRRQGRWRNAVASLRRALVRDPRSAQVARELMRTECLMRDWPAAERDGAHAVAIAPDNLLLQFEKSSIDFWARGDLAPIRAVFALVPPGVDPDGVITLTRWEVAVVAHDFAAAEQAVEQSGLATFSTQFGIVMPKSYLLGCVALARGDRVRARPLLEEACAAAEAQAQRLPQDAFRQARLGVILAYLGRKEEAIRHGQRAIELLPESKDTYLGPNLSAQLAVIYAQTGEVELAVALLDRLLRTPGGLLPGSEGNITQNDLRQRWQWNPLRSHPRFQQLVSGSEPKTVAN